MSTCFPAHAPCIATVQAFKSRRGSADSTDFYHLQALQLCAELFIRGVIHRRVDDHRHLLLEALLGLPLPEHSPAMPDYLQFPLYRISTC